MSEFFASIAGHLNELTGLQFSIHGYISILLTLVGVVGLYIGLLYLLRLSHRTGHDDAVQDYRDPRYHDPDDGDDAPRGGPHA